jgi:hypothetical protein
VGSVMYPIRGEGGVYWGGRFRPKDFAALPHEKGCGAPRAEAPPVEDGKQMLRCMRQFHKKSLLIASNSYFYLFSIKYLLLMIIDS